MGNQSILDQVIAAYRTLNHNQLLLFLHIRNLSATGKTDVDLAKALANHDMRTYCFPTSLGNQVNIDIVDKYHDVNRSAESNFSEGAGGTVALPTPPSSSPRHMATLITDIKLIPRRPLSLPDLPVEILAEILDHTADWELSKAIGVPTSLPTPPQWARANPTDHAVLTGCLPLIRAANPALTPPTKIGANVVVRFGYVHVLEYFLTKHGALFKTLFDGDLIPTKASRHGRTGVLDWWKHALEHHSDLVRPPKPSSISDCIDGASRYGQTASLDWWLRTSHTPSTPPLPFLYTDSALESASAKNQIAVLDWWQRQHLGAPSALPLKPGRAMDLASTAGHVGVLAWWAASGLEFKYDRHTLYHASCHGQVAVLEWWLRSGLKLELVCDCFFDGSGEPGDRGSYNMGAGSMGSMESASGNVLVGATRHDRPEVLEWWNQSGLSVRYRMCDVEEALEDAIGGGERARKWWKKKGVDFNANDKEWMKLQSLN